MTIPSSLGDRLDAVNEDILLRQSENGLTFGTDAYLLAAYIRQMKRAHAIELGSGTGIVSLLLLKKEKVARISAIEVQSRYADLTKRNAEENGLGKRLRVLECDARDVRLEEIGEEVPLVFSNPPYMKTDTGKRNRHDEKYIARHEVHGTIEDFCCAASRLLRHGGRFVCVYRPDRLSDLFRALAACRLEPKRMTLVHADQDAEPCCVLIESVKGAASGLRISAPLFLYEPLDGCERTRRLTMRAQKIYERCSFDD